MRQMTACSPRVSAQRLAGRAAMAGVLTVLASASQMAWAQTGESTPERAIRLGDGVLLYPQVKLSLGHDDNVRSAASGALSANVTALAPAVKLEADSRTGTYTLNYAGVYTRYSGLSADNTENHDVSATGRHDFSARSRLNWGILFQDKYDPRADAAVQSAQPDRWQGNTLSALYGYGAKDAMGRIETEAALTRKRYQNNPLTTAISDLDSQQLAGRFFWRVMPRTYLVAEARAAVNDYRVGTTNNNTDTRLLAGVTWEATAATTGTIKLGQQKKDFDNRARADASKATYEASVEWKPLSYTAFTLLANRAAQDSVTDGDYNMANSLALTWSHQWNQSLSSRVGLSTARAKYVNSDRVDDTTSASLGVLYGLGRHYTLGLDLVRTERESTLAPYNFKRNTVLLSVSAAL